MAIWGISSNGCRLNALRLATDYNAVSGCLKQWGAKSYTYYTLMMISLSKLNLFA